ncbi:MAG: ethanolamine ammonia lyase-activating protein [Deltaproteobacteria bacterium]|nr:ethanolamine ammonia lyase-activating protein [Deltaproteobacteria bacterium]
MKFEKIDRAAEVMDTPYDAWASSQGIDVIKGYFVDDVYTLPLKWWERMGGYGVFINLEGSGYLDDAYVCAIPPGKSLKPQRHLFDAMVYILEGRGATTVWQENGARQSFEWHKGSLFAIPINAGYQHFNGQGDQQVRMVCVTNAPLVFNLFHNEDFVLKNPYVFRDRFSGKNDYFAGVGKLYNDRVLETNFVSDVLGIEPIAWNERGKGNATMFFELASSTMGAHTSQFPVGIYKKAHRHGPGAHVLILTGNGYTLLWPEGKERMRVNWGPGSIVVPPEQWFHQHFNSGNKPARYLALKMLSRRYKLVPGKIKSDVPLNQGGWQIEYEDEDPEIRRIFEEECAKAGAEVKMPRR